MRVVSLIPSITETLIHCGVNVIGRSRFCIHPAPQIDTIPKVGGTKDIDWQKLVPLKPDLVILDKEENTLEMAQTCPFPYIAIHIHGLDNIAGELSYLAKRLHSEKLSQVAKRWQAISQQPSQTLNNWSSLPGVEQWITPVADHAIQQVEYLIWRDPWMCIGPNTFIYSVLQQLGLQQFLPLHTAKYPEIDLPKLNPENTLLLFSSEPFPFHRYIEDIRALGFASAIVDGECFSWYGIRSLEFLEANCSAENRV